MRAHAPSADLKPQFLRWLKNHRPPNFFKPPSEPDRVTMRDITEVTPATGLAKRMRQPIMRRNYFATLITDRKLTPADKLFNTQADKLLELEFDQCVRVKPDVFWEHIKQLGALVNTIKPQRDCLPFIIVIPRSVVSLQRQASRLGIDCKDGSQIFSKDGLPDVAGLERPQLPYLAVNVSMGTKFLGIAPTVAYQKFNRSWPRQKLLPLTIDEGFAIVAHSPESLKAHAVDFIGTQFGSNGVAGMFYQEDGVWTIRRPLISGAQNRAPAFCHERIVP